MALLCRSAVCEPFGHALFPTSFIQVDWGSEKSVVPLILLLGSLCVELAMPKEGMRGLHPLSSVARRHCFSIWRRIQCIKNALNGLRIIH